MSVKTKIFVVKLKELLTFAIIGFLSFLLIVILVLFFFPKRDSSSSSQSQNITPATKTSTLPTNTTETTALYTPGVYNASIILGDSAVDIAVTVDEDHINSISLLNLEESVDVMYPLVRPALEELSAQIIENQSLENVTYSSNNQYTSLVLLSAIEEAIKKASLD